MQARRSRSRPSSSLALSLVGLAAFAGLMSRAGDARATVTQVDGTIVPALAAMQAALDTWEPPAGTIDAVADAAEVPEIFRPRLSAPVVFLDMREGAGFENSFGWYNVGDDVQTAAGRAANLRPVMGCGVTMVAGAGSATQHGGNPAFYAVNAEEATTVSVDFAAEQTAGRYKGGFIGFYLITPENNPSNNNCGDFKNGTDGQSLFGYIYFTQKDLNNDGDFVHHLVYKSNVVDRFLFGFEDLFRGGDNDYEDMAMRIDGLTPPCVPQAEVCDGLDNDCDGLVDAADPGLSGVGDACTCDGLTLTCDNGPRFGACRTGVTACVGGAITCHGTGTPSAEVCNAIDDNCNASVDEPPVAGTGTSCDGPDADLCPEGALACVAGGITCTDTTGPNLEACNGLDDDCDGLTDEGNPGGGGACGTGLGECSPGTLVCSGGALVCTGSLGPTPEACNGLDDDCDGVVDDSPGDVGMPCGATDAGECTFGVTICTAGAPQCAGELGPAPELCNGLDDDCDGAVDDAPVDVGQPCGQSTGACEPGTLACSGGSLVCTGGVGPTSEVCNGLDDDCDGAVDDDVPGDGDPCGGGTGPCSGGVNRCIGGALECVGGTGGGTEVCNDVDDDCDGQLDEGDLCAGGVCDNGTCAAPCLPGEFPCPAGLLCQEGFCVTDPCFGVTCPADADGDAQICRQGACVKLCSVQPCESPTVCRGRDGVCVPNTCEYLPLCADDELCVGGQCVSDPCAGVTCGDGEFCRQGECVGSCAGVGCPVGQACRDGACVDTGCARDCPDGQVCDPARGACVPDACDGVRCAPLEACDPLTGECIPDPCNGVTCPDGQACELGQCGEGASGAIVSAAGGGGCAAGGGAGSPAALALLAGLALWLRQRRGRAGRAAAAVAVAAAALAGGGCSVNEYCLACEVVPRDAGGLPDDGGGSSGDAGDAGGGGCDPANLRPETCNNADDDCDGVADEAFDLAADELNCGACGTECNKPGAQTQCQAGACALLGCFPGFVDRNGDLAGPYAASDGCEYACFLSNGGVETCDGVDNDCDGVADDAPVDAGAPCAAVAPPAGACVADGVLACAGGALVCAGATEPVAEACDAVDQDCDGLVDDGVTQACYTGATGTSGVGACRPGTQACAGGAFGACVGQVTPTTEACNGLDDDCDSVVDDGPGGGPLVASCYTGAAGTSGVGTCRAGTQTCQFGALGACVGQVTPAAERCGDVADTDCDGLDDVAEGCLVADGEDRLDAPGGALGEGTGGANHSYDLVLARGGGARVYAAWSQLVDTTTEVYLRRSDDGGRTWGTIVNVTAALTATAVKPQLAVAPGASDRVVVAYQTVAGGVRDVVVQVSTNSGGTFGAASAALDAAGDSFHHVVAILGTTVVVAWEKLDTATLNRDVMSRASTDGGVTFGAETKVNVSTGTRFAGRPVVAITASGRVTWAWREQRTGATRDIYAASVASATTAPTTNARIDADTTDRRDSDFPRLVVAAERAYLVWQDVSTLAGGGSDVVYARSTDGGSTWGVEAVIDDPAAELSSSFTPVIAVDPRTASATDDLVAIAWEDRRQGTQVFVAVSGDGGGTFAAPVRASNETGDPIPGETAAPALAAPGGGVLVVAYQNQLAGGARHVFAAASIDGGATWPSTHDLVDEGAGPASAPQVVATTVGTEAGAVVGWTDFRADSVRGDIYAAVTY